MNVNLNPSAIGLGPPQTTPAKPPAPASGPADRFENAPSAEDPDRLRRAARTLTQGNRLKKSESNYRPTAWSRASDGTLYISYGQSGQGKSAYLAAVDPNGRIAWELPLGENRISHVGVAPDGRIHLGTPEGQLICTADGRLAETRTGGPAIRAHHQDGTGMRLEHLQDGEALRAVSPDGQEVALPAPLLGVRARSIQPTPEGGLMVLTSGHAVRLAPGGASATATPLPTWPAEDRLSYSTERAWGLRDGDVLVQRNSYLTMRSPRGGMFGMPGMGRHFDPDSRMPTTLTRTAFIRLAADGTQKWATGEFSDTTRFAVNPDGSLFFNDGGKEVRIVDPEGKPTKVADLSARADAFRSGVRPGTLLVRHEDRIARLGADGASLAEVRLDPSRSKFQLEGDLEDGRILFREGPVLWSCDPTSATWTRLTDLEVDHSTRPEDLVAPAPPEQAGTIEKGDDWIVIGGVRLPRRES